MAAPLQAPSLRAGVVAGKSGLSPPAYVPLHSSNRSSLIPKRSTLPARCNTDNYVVRAVASSDVQQAVSRGLGTAHTSSSQPATKYHFLVANAKFMLDEEEHFQEQLKERKRWLQEQGREQDFWLLYEPAFLDSFPEITKRVKRPAVTLVSTDRTWIVFMKIRLDRVLQGEFECDSREEALKAQPVSMEFDVPANWTAPYTKYPKDWWKPYVPN